MAIVRKYLARDNYTKADNNVVKNKSLTDQAKLLYWYLASHQNSFQLNDGLTKLALGWSQDKVTRYKKELKNEDLILTDKIDTRTYFIYIGSSVTSASMVKKNWERYEKMDDQVK